MSDNPSPDRIIEDLGGCGRFQVRMSIVVHMMKTLVTFSVTSMIIISPTPKWWCDDESKYKNISSCVQHENGTQTIVCTLESCSVNWSACNNYGYSETGTIVEEFNLVCNQDYIPSTVMTLQVAGTLAGNLLAGQISDMFGRKPPFFTSIVILIVSNLIGFLSFNWIMFAVARVLVGLGAGCFLSVQYSLLSEFSLAKWRSWIIGFPSWPIQACVFALLGWLIQDWRHIQLLCCLLGVPCLLAWFVIPESFRWYIAHDKPEKAEVIIRRIAAFNKRQLYHVGHLIEKPKSTTPSFHKYSVIDMLSSKLLIRITLLSALNWFALGLVSYGLAFEIQALSGNVYLNFFLFSLVGIPSKGIGIWLQNRLGRRLLTMVCYAIVGICGIIVGTVQSINAENRDILTNTFALIAYAIIALAWGPIQTMTIELYPTVIRNVSFGTLGVVGRVGAMVGPQLVYLNNYVTGLLYFVCGAVSFICVAGCVGLPETKDSNLSDKLGETKNVATPV
ncbi:organic cation transporter protein-like [Mercenaria mercenaria]|uniref:organic cation transporter protein-like n=1 Tax=Mercenaria mercenaria TaxID=6596 RepID=UPI00234F563D|nr:organic cation transporter protein-like [Mercenaria mercenaria]XP_045211469.2 organic cation transporter protein-like [Mercenaria mercenaria]XP_053393426.1 organic cation transporter protein-like [Mercenaria mercenaria]